MGSAAGGGFSGVKESHQLAAATFDPVIQGEGRLLCLRMAFVIYGLVRYLCLNEELSIPQCSALQVAFTSVQWCDVVKRLNMGRAA